MSVGAHLHNRNGFAAANALAALSAGAQWLETSFAALGGDLWFPGDPTVLGNMATEDLVHLLIPMVVTKVMHSYQERKFQRSFNEHDDLIEAIERQDPEWAEAIMRAHILGGLSSFKEQVRRTAASGPGEESEGEYGA